MLSASRLLCLIGRHRRSRGQARRSEGGFRSRCKRCGVPMHKSAEGSWKVDKAALPEEVGTTPLPEPKQRFRFFGKGRKSPAA